MDGSNFFYPFSLFILKLERKWQISSTFILADAIVLIELLTFTVTYESPHSNIVGMVAPRGQHIPAVVTMFMLVFIQRMSADHSQSFHTHAGAITIFTVRSIS